VLSLGSVETSQAHPLDSRDIVYIDGVPCNSACQSYMAWSRQMLSASRHQAPTQLRQRPASAIAHRATTPARQVRVARQAVPLPPARVALLQPADHAAGKPDGPPDKPGAEAIFNTTTEVPEHVATAHAQQTTAAPPALSPEQRSTNDDSAVASRSESVPPGDVEKAASTPPDIVNNPAILDAATDTKAASAPPYDVAALEPTASAAADSNTRAIRQQVIAGTVIAEHVMTLRDAEKAASGSPSNSDQMVVILIARPEINAISDLTGKGIAIDDRYSVSRDKVRTAIAAAGAAEIQLSEGQTKAIDRLIRGEVPAAVLTLVYPETGFPQFVGFKIFRIPLAPRSLKARL